MQKLEVIERSHHEFIEEYCLSFTKNGAGWSLDCDKEGNIIHNPYNPMPWRSISFAIAGYCDGEYDMRIENRSRNVQ